MARLIDREKVIRAVDSCFDYWLEQHRCLQPLEQEVVRQLKADALTLLKEQEPKLVKVVKITSDYELYYCPGCDRPFCDTYYVKPKFCDKCGQELKWE